MSVRVVLIGGQGYPVTETLGGLPRLKERFEALGFAVQIFEHFQRQQIHDWVVSFSGRLAFIGDSLGAMRAAIYPGDLHQRAVDFAGGFQPSDWDPAGQGEVFSRSVTVAPNVRVAHCIYNPVWIETGGLGAAHYVVPPGSKTILTTTVHYGPHPDDWGYSQDLMFNHAVQVLK